MSSAVVSTSAATGRLFVFDDDPDPEVGSHSKTSRVSLDPTAEDDCPHMAFRSLQKSSLAHVLQSKINHQKSTIPLSPASRLEISPAPEMASSGIPALDALTGGLPRGCLTEICGPASSGRTTVLLAALAAATRRGEYCALIDASDALDPHSAAAAGIELDHLLWVRCGEEPPRRLRDTEKKNISNSGVGIRNKKETEHRLEQVLRAADLLLQSGGFGLIILDLADLPPQAARRIPLTTWFRFRRAIEYQPTVLLAIEQQPIAGSCSSLLLQLGVPSTQYSSVPGAQYPVSSSNRILFSSVADCEATAAQELKPSHSHLLTGLEITVELIRSRHDRKPARSAAFEAKTAWAG
jgi:hypothetical protein